MSTLVNEEKQVKEIVMFRDFLIVDVMISKYISDCTCGGVSSKYDSLYLCRDYVTLEQVKAYCKEHNEDVSRFVKVDLEHKKYTHGYISVKSINYKETSNGGYYCAGGNYIYTCDSRYKEIVGCSYPVAIHDRREHY